VEETVQKRCVEVVRSHLVFSDETVKLSES
jgi:hypothetical protein